MIKQKKRHELVRTSNTYVKDKMGNAQTITRIYTTCT